METKKQMPHLGEFVRNLTYKKGHTASSLSNILGKHHNTVTGYSTEPSLHARILWDISLALNYDIFEYLSNSLNLSSEKNEGNEEAKTKQQKIEELELLVKDLQKEVNIYKDLLRR